MFEEQNKREGAQWNQIQAMLPNIMKDERAKREFMFVNLMRFYEIWCPSKPSGLNMREIRDNIGGYIVE